MKFDEFYRTGIALLTEEEKTRTPPFTFDHAAFTGKTTRKEPSDVHGHYMEKTYDVVKVYTDPSTSPYYIWTKEGNGAKLATALNRAFAGKTVTAVEMWAGWVNTRISSRDIRVCVPPPPPPPPPPPLPPPPPPPPKPRQMEFGVFSGTRLPD